MTPEDALLDGVDLPARVEVHVYAGADGEFTLVEDRDDKRWVRTRLSWHDDAAELVVHDPEGDLSTLPADRAYDVQVHGAQPDDRTAVDQRVFAVLDRARIGYDLKAAAYDVVRGSTSPAHALGSLQALDLAPALLSAISELLLAR
jgi:hypothetical protein